MRIVNMFVFLFGLFVLSFTIDRCYMFYVNTIQYASEAHRDSMSNQVFEYKRLLQDDKIPDGIRVEVAKKYRNKKYIYERFDSIVEYTNKMKSNKFIFQLLSIILSGVIFFMFLYLRSQRIKLKRLY